MEYPKVYVIIDENDKIWKDEAHFSKRDLIAIFIRGWLPRCKNMSDFHCEQIWNYSFEKSGWKVRELTTADNGQV